MRDEQGALGEPQPHRSARSTTRTSGTRRARPGRLLPAGHQRARAHEHRVRAHHRQRHPGGVLMQLRDVCELMPIHAAAVRKQIAVRHSRSDLSARRARTRSRSRRSRHEFAELVDEGLRAFNVERIHAGDMTTGDRLADGVALADRRGPHAADDGAAARRHRPAGRDAAGARSARARRRRARSTQLEALLKQPEPQTTLVLVAAPLDKRSRMYKLLQKHATIVECGVHRGSGRRRALGPDARRRRGRRDRSGRRRGCSRSAPAPTSSGCAPTSSGCCSTRSARRRSRSTTCGEVAGPAALQDDWAMTNAIEAGRRREALRQLALMLDAGAPPEKILGQLGWLVRTKFPAIAPARAAAGGRRAVPDRPRPEAVGRRSARPARTAGRRIVCGEAGGDAGVAEAGFVDFRRRSRRRAAATCSGRRRCGE